MQLKSLTFGSVTHTACFRKSRFALLIALAAINIKTRWQGAGTKPGFNDLSQAENWEQAATGLMPCNWDVWLS